MNKQFLKTDTEWWRGASIYQIYPRSFFDVSGDGVGDLAGITAKMDYLNDLGIDAIWISPFFASPMKDFGYDISNYRSIDPIFGSMNDFEVMVAAAHAQGLKVIIDQVYSHTSDKHEWFQTSRQCRSNDKADWYVWADPLDDGSAPNNWLSIFGGSAWKWDSTRCQYYLHNFLDSQPDLNFHNPDVRQAQLDNLRFWLDKGVDGVRLDVVNFYYHDLQLRSNPAVTSDTHLMLNARADNPYTFQEHLYDIDRSENIEFLKQLRNVLNEYPGSTSIGEISSRHGLQRMAEYTQGDEHLHMAYTFELLSKNLDVEFIRNVIESGESIAADGWPCWAIGNHDVERFISRWGEADGLGRVAIALLFAMRGSLCFYQGDELCLPQAHIAEEDIQDPYGLHFWPMFSGRDGCRTPMVWDSEKPFAGFSHTSPWLPIPEAHLSLCVKKKQACVDSSLQLFRALTRLRRGSSALLYGAIRVVQSSGSVIVIERAHANDKLVIAINFSHETQVVTLPYPSLSIIDVPSLNGDLQRKQLTLEPMNAVYMAA